MATETIQTQVSCVPLMKDRPIPVDLDKDIAKPGVARANMAIDREFPRGPPDHFVANRSVMQQHVDFFDINKDGILTPSETYFSLRSLGFNVLICGLSAMLIHGMMSYPTQDNWWPHPLFYIKIKNIHKGKHGSDSGVYDPEGRFIPQRFEEIFSKYDKDNKGGLTFKEGVQFLQAHRNAWDFVGQLAAMFEWGFLYLLAANHGILAKEDVRAAYDGSLFERVKKHREDQEAQQKKEMQEKRKIKTTETKTKSK